MMDEWIDERKSKSQKKRDAEKLQQFGMQLVALPALKLDKLSLTDALRRAIDQAKAIKSHGALRRQMQLIGKLMRSANSDLLLTEFNALLAENNTQTEAFHDVEQWRHRLITSGREAINEFISLYPQVDTQQLRQLIKKAIEEQSREHSSGHKTGASRALFRFLRACS